MDSSLTVYGIKTGGEAMDLGLRVPNPWGNQGICMHGRAKAPIDYGNQKDPLKLPYCKWCTTLFNITAK